jgi:hypothetical protein
MALGLPIKLVVLTIVGMAGLAAMLDFITASERAIPEPMHAVVERGEIIILSESNTTVKISVAVMNSRDGTPVNKASVALSGLKAAAVNITDNEGKALLMFNKTDFDLKGNEGYLALNVKAGGFQDYTSEFAVKIVRSRTS